MVGLKVDERSDFNEFTSFIYDMSFTLINTIGECFDRNIYWFSSLF